MPTKVQITKCYNKRRNKNDLRGAEHGEGDMSEIPDRITTEAANLFWQIAKDAPTTDENGDACYSVSVAREIISAALLAAEQRGREMEREECAKEVTSLAACFAVHSQNPSKSEGVAEICRINERMLDGLAAAIRSRKEG